MKYLLLVGHAALADGVRSALEMLMGARDNVLSCGLDEGESPEEFRARLSALLEPLAPTDQVILLSDIVGGSPQMRKDDNHAIYSCTRSGHDILTGGAL